LVRRTFCVTMRSELIEFPWIILWHIFWKPRHVAGQWYNKRVSATAVTSLNNAAVGGNDVFYAVRRQADSDATMEHVTLRRTHQQSNSKKKCFLWGPPRDYIRRADESFDLVRRLGVGLQEVLGPLWGGHGQSSAVSSRRLVSAVRKLLGHQEYPLLEDCNRATTSEGCSKLRRLVWVTVMSSVFSLVLFTELSFFTS
jgi:hypothetical protein